MNAKFFPAVILFQFILATGLVRLDAQTADATDGVVCVTNRSLLQQGSSLTLLSTDISVADGIKVFTNGTFAVNGGRPRPLQEGQVLRSDGFLLNSDGSIAPVCDHLTMTGPIVMLYRDGEASALTSPLTLPDGSTINPDGSYVRSSGRRARLVDGQMLTLAGDSLDGLNTISLKSGKVVVFKGAALIPLEAPNVVMGMFDGTRVSSDGLVTFHDGRTLQLAEGRVITVPGVRASW